MTLKEYRKKIGQGVNEKNKYIKNLFSRIFLSITLLLSILILCNMNSSIKTFIKENLFETDFKFSTITKLYNKYFLNINNESIKENSAVASVKSIEYTESEKYLDGVKLITSSNYPIKIIASGIVVFIGEKEGYGNTIIIQQSNGVDVWYGNISDVSVKLYDYVEKDTIVGTSTNFIYLVFQKNGVFQDYNEFIK